MNFTEVLADVSGMTPANQAMLDLIAQQLGVPANPDFALLQQAVMAHLAAAPADPSPPVVEALIQAHRLNMATLAAIAGGPAPAAPGATAPAPGPVPALAVSAVHTNEDVLDAVALMDPATDLANLQDIASAYGLPTVGNPYALRGNIEAHIHGLTSTDPAPAAVDAPMNTWMAAHPAPAATTGMWSRFMNQLHTNNVVRTVAVGGLAIVALVAVIMAFNRGGDGSTPANGQEPDPTATAAATATPETDGISEDREELIEKVEDARSKTDDEDLREELDNLRSEVEDAKTAEKLKELEAELESLVREAEDDKDDEEGDKPEPIDPAATDKPEPAYTGTHRQPEKDFKVMCQKTFMEDTRWLLCEPGALQTEVGSFRWPEAEGVTYRSNCPEGFMWYGSMGQGKITTDKSTLVMQPENGLNYLVVIRCPLNDAKVDSDRNLTLRISDIVVGHAGWTPVDVLGGVKNPEDAAYVSMEWFGEQLVVSGTKSGTNCGATGCSRTIVVLHDADSGLHERYLVTDVKGETNDADNDGIEDYASAKWQKIYTNAR